MVILVCLTPRMYLFFPPSYQILFFINFFNLYFLLIVKKYFYFYCSVVDSQCVSFGCTTKWFSYTYIYSFLDSFLIQVITEYWVEFPVLYSKSLLVIHLVYSSVCRRDHFFKANMTRIIFSNNHEINNNNVRKATKIVKTCFYWTSCIHSDQ